MRYGKSTKTRACCFPPRWVLQSEFTLPYELRAYAWKHQTAVYNALFACASGTLRDFGLNDKPLRGELGMTAVLHTHSRRLEYHPHLHIIVPGGGIDLARRQWKKAKDKYLFNAFALASVFRGRMMAALNENSAPVPGNLPKKWVVDCRRVGKGEPALKYLSRYLYRGVISEKNIIANRQGIVMFCYVDSHSGETQYRELKGEDFLWLVLKHILPKGFRRVRDYGFLHGNAKHRMALLQLILQVSVKTQKPLTFGTFMQYGNANNVNAEYVRNFVAFYAPGCDALSAGFLSTESGVLSVFELLKYKNE